MHVIFIIGLSEFTDQLARLLRIISGCTIHTVASVAEVEDLWRSGQWADLVLLDLAQLDEEIVGALVDAMATQGQHPTTIGFGQAPDPDGCRSLDWVEPEISLEGLGSVILRAIAQEDGAIGDCRFSFALSLLLMNRTSVRLRCLLAGQCLGEAELEEGTVTSAWCLEPPTTGEEAISSLLSFDAADLQVAPPSGAPRGPALALTLQDLFGHCLPWASNEDLEIALAPELSIIGPDAPGLSEEAHRLLEVNMANVKDTLEQALTIEGAIGAALVDIQSGMCLGISGGNGLNMEIAAAGSSDLVRAELKSMEKLGVRDAIEDILITLGKQYHLICISGTKLFIYLVLNRQNANLALARHKLVELEDNLQV